MVHVPCHGMLRCGILGAGYLEPECNSPCLPGWCSGHRWGSLGACLLPGTALAGAVSAFATSDLFRQKQNKVLSGAPVSPYLYEVGGHLRLLFGEAF